MQITLQQDDGIYWVAENVDLATDLSWACLCSWYCGWWAMHASLDSVRDCRRLTKHTQWCRLSGLVIWSTSRPILADWLAALWTQWSVVIAMWSAVLHGQFAVAVSCSHHGWHLSICCFVVYWLLVRCARSRAVIHVYRARARSCALHTPSVYCRVRPM